MIAFIRTSEIYNDSRATKEILALSEAGYDMFVVGWDRNGGGRTNYNKIFNNAKTIFAMYNKITGGSLGGVKGIFKLIGFMQFAYKELVKEKDTIDAVHVCDLDTGIPACLFCKKYGKKLVYDIYDYYADSHELPKYLRKFVEWLENKIVDCADVTVICTEERLEQIAKAKPRKIVVVHNSPDAETVAADCTKYDYAYCGSFGERRLLREILDSYKDNCDFKFCFAGLGILERKVRECADKYKNFGFKGSLPYGEVLKLESQATVMSAIYEPTIRNHRLCAPNKFYEALALGKPLIVCRGTGIDKIVEENNIGIAINYDVKEFYKALRSLLSNSELCTEMGQRARKLYEEKYNWKIMEERLIKLYKELSAI